MTVKHTYDPAKIVAAVEQVLRDAGVDPDMNTEGYGHIGAIAGAGMLLRGLGVSPAVDPVDHYRRTDTGSWEDADNRAAAVYAESHG
jgi:hypothetical protein